MAQGMVVVSHFDNLRSMITDCAITASDLANRMELSFDQKAELFMLLVKAALKE